MKPILLSVGCLQTSVALAYFAIRFWNKLAPQWIAMALDAAALALPVLMFLWAAACIENYTRRPRP